MPSLLVLASSGAAVPIPVALMVPFVLLLLLIAAMPLAPHGVKGIWEKYYPHISIGLGLFVAAWFLWGIEGGPATVAHTALE